MRALYKTYSDFLAEKFPLEGKIQKIGVSVGFSCPNRDGTIGRGGCAYCNNASFSPDYINQTDIKSQVEKGIAFFSRKYPSMKYLAYFQSYTNTHGPSLPVLLDIYRQAANIPGVLGLIIGTRPDCVANELLDELAEINRTRHPVFLEFGAESSHNSTLDAVNRCHTWETTVDAVRRASARGISVGLHFIMGLPGESEEMMLQSVSKAVQLPIETLKFHQLQIIRGTRFAEEYSRNPGKFNLFSPEEYASLCLKIIELVSPHNIAIERFVSQAPDNLLIAPRWGLKNYQFTNILNQKGQKE